MKRIHAIERYSRINLAKLSQRERAEQLDVMTLEDWTDIEEWALLPKEIQNEFKGGREILNPELEKYDAVLMIWLKHSLRHVTNEYLCEALNIDRIIGEPLEFESCPCCGYNTIEERGSYNICKLCWWEDDGQDNKNAEVVLGGPNYGISLAMGRYNYLIHGLYDPNRTDLMEKKAPTREFKRGRFFEINNNGCLVEKGTHWQWNISLSDA